MWISSFDNIYGGDATLAEGPVWIRLVGDFEDQALYHVAEQLARMPPEPFVGWMRVGRYAAAAKLLNQFCDRCVTLFFIYHSAVIVVGGNKNLNFEPSRGRPFGFSTSPGSCQ